LALRRIEKTKARWKMNVPTDFLLLEHLARFCGFQRDDIRKMITVKKFLLKLFTMLKNNINRIATRFAPVGLNVADECRACYNARLKEESPASGR
jgi:hypothetical protein